MPEMWQRTADPHSEIRGESRGESRATVLGLLDLPKMSGHEEFLRDWGQQGSVICHL